MSNGAAMPPSNPSLTDGRGGGEYRRRAHSAYPSSAIAAAEAAASYILSDGPKSKKPLVRNRSASASSNGGSTATAVSNTNITHSGCGPGGGSFLLRVHRQRERLMQRRQREKAFSFKITAWVLVFVLGTLYLFQGGERQHQDQRNLDYYSKVKQSKDRDRDGNSAGDHKVGVPLPPNVERQQHREQFVAQFVRGEHHHNNKQKSNGSNSHSNEETEVRKVPKVISIAEDANADAQDTTPKHAIPEVLIFTYHTNLINTPESKLTDEEDVALSQNVKNIVSLHPESSVRFLNDDDCIASIKVALGPDTNLTKYFTNEEKGMFKADICRGAALYETGGLYFDIDIEPRMPIWDAISPQTEFVTTLVHKDSKHLGGFFQAFVGVTARHQIMKRYLELFVQYYEGELKVKGPLGVYFLRMAYDAIVGKHDDEEKIDLWQEVRYNPDAFPDVKRDHWGKRRACQMLVVAAPKKLEGFKREQMVPLFSHANGSRMCGGKDTNRKGGYEYARKGE